MQDQKTTNQPTTPTVPTPPTAGKSEDKKPETTSSAMPKPASADNASAKAGNGNGAGNRLPNARPSMMPKNDLLRRIVEKIKNSENILVALSRDPSVDELAASIGLTIFLDGLQKHTTAIYSGQAPDALQFLQPEGTFETNTDSLQDFIISLNKEKADHLRYKLDGDYVRVYITPYKTLITEDDLEFSRGDYNVELVLAIGVPSAEDLDGALSEYGRIMHDAMIVDITCDAPGKFGDVEWSDPGASSVSEMVTKLIFALEGSDVKLEKDVATALLTGIVAATGRFSNDRTNSDTMQLASKLMAMGADQQLISAHVMDNDPGPLVDRSEFDVVRESGPEVDRTNLAVHQAHEALKPSESVVVAPDVPSGVTSATTPTPPAMTPADIVAQNRAAEAAVSQAVNAATAEAAAAGATGVGIENGQPKDYAQMMAEALSEPGGNVVTPVGMTAAQGVSTGTVAPQGTQVAPGAQSAPNPAPQEPAQPVVQAAPVNGQPVQNAAGVVLPPPPAPAAAGRMMPPVLPQVQVPDEMHAQQAQAAPQQPPTQAPGQAGAQSGAFQIPGAA